MNDNKLIAEFMDWTPCDSNDNTMYANPQDHSDAWSTDEMRFHESWDWLMPVIEEIDHLQRERIQSIEDALSTRCIGDVYNAVVEFIKSHTK
tara:strand:- start:122 stop:397 length:276 start_codon:yes stop_codon:yes gene_type:complete